MIYNADAELHFRATSHGNGPCDGLGGNLKRLAACASLQLPSSKAIVTLIRLYDWAKSSLKQTAIYFSSKDYSRTPENLFAIPVCVYSHHSRNQKDL